MHDTFNLLKSKKFPTVFRKSIDTLQINLGYKCNQSCFHCHVNASPDRKEVMQKDIVDACINFIDHNKIKSIDLTGGAPELNPHFRYLVREARKIGVDIIDRCNLTILFEQNQSDLVDFFVENEVQIIASLPCYTSDNVDAQRGKGVFDKSIKALEILNQAGYGVKKNLNLNLVYNPIGATLPPSQYELKKDYKKFLKEKFNIVFNELFTITNMPIKRFGSTLISEGNFDNYMDKLCNAFDKNNLENIMCKNLISVSFDGFIYDCDFNQMLGLNSKKNETKLHISSLNMNEIENNQIATSGHCFGCTAGQGSSCGGALS